MRPEMIQVYLYGDLRRYADPRRESRECLVQMPVPDNATVGQVLREIGIDPGEVAHIFLNNRLLKAGSSMAPWLGYQTAQERIPPSGGALDAAIHSGDRLGLFPLRMAMLVV